MAEDSAIITTPDPTPTPATPPPATNAELVDLKKQHNDLVYKMRMTEKELLEERTNAAKARADLEDSKKSSSELLRLKLAYEAGVPSRFLNLVTGTTEAEVKDQIKTITESLVNAQPATPAPAPSVDPPPATPQVPAQPAIPPAPAPSGRPGESWIDKYTRSTPEERQKMSEVLKEQGPAFVLT